MTDSPPVGFGIVGCGGGLTYPPATAVIMNDLGTKKAGDGAAVNQLARQVGGALGVAIVGSVFAAIYAALITDEGDVPAAAKESIEAATDVLGLLADALLDQRRLHLGLLQPRERRQDADRHVIIPNAN